MMRWILRSIFFGLIAVLCPQDHMQSEAILHRSVSVVKTVLLPDMVPEPSTRILIPTLPAVLKEKEPTTVIHSYQENIGVLTLLDADALERREESLLLLNSPTFQYENTLSSGPLLFFIEFENDIFVEKDYYFTNGAAIGCMYSGLKKFFPSLLFPAVRSAETHQYGLCLRQNMYTSIYPEATEIVYGDRPFSGILLLNFFRMSQFDAKGMVLRSELQLGVIGRASLASAIQEMTHHLFPTGWRFQIANDLLLNYNLSILKELIRTPSFRMDLQAGFQAGSYLSRISLGQNFSFTPATNTLKTKTQWTDMLPDNRHWMVNNSRLVIFGGIEGHLTGYNASLMGGMFNRKSPYVIDPTKIKRIVVEAHLGLAYISHKYCFGIKLVSLTPEFKGGRPHQWGAITISNLF